MRFLSSLATGRVNAAYFFGLFRVAPALQSRNARVKETMARECDLGMEYK